MINHHKCTLAFVLCLLLASASFSAIADRIPLKSSNDVTLVDFMNLSERLLVRYAADTYIRVFRMRVLDGPSECGGSPERCPRYRLYIAVLVIDEDPERRVYVLPQAFGWDNVHVIYHTDAEHRDEFIEMEVDEKVIGTNPKISWFDIRKRKIWINLYEGYIQ